MDYAALRAELTTDPVTLGYSGLTDTQAAAKLNATDTGRTRSRTAVPTGEVLRQIDLAAWPTAGTVNDAWLRTMLAVGTIDATDSILRANFGTVFPNSGATQATRARLLALSTQTVSRAVELGLGTVATNDVTIARAGVW